MNDKQKQKEIKKAYVEKDRIIRNTFKEGWFSNVQRRYSALQEYAEH